LLRSLPRCFADDLPAQLIRVARALRARRHAAIVAQLGTAYGTAAYAN
jgi:hypothetical protein